MNQKSQNVVWLRDEMLHLLSLSASLAGLCITGVTLLHTMYNNAARATLVDDILATSALLFLLCTYLIYFTLRTKRKSLAQRFEKLADSLFLLALTSMVASGFILLYTFL